MTGAADPTRLDQLAGFLARLAGSGLSDPDDPAPGLPAWTAQLIDALHDGLYDGQPPAAAQDWAGRVHAELARLAGRVPFSVLHDWHADTVAPLLDPVCGPSELAGLHARARSGEPAPAEDWLAALGPALRAIYHRAYDYAGGYAVNYANAEVYGLANDFGEEGTREYATYYAELATGANRTACADANAIAVGQALAECFAAADPVGYAETFPYAAVRAYAQALGNSAHSADLAEPVDSAEPVAERRSAAYRRLADGLLDSLAGAGR